MTARVSLRRVEPDDYPLIRRWQNDPDVFRWMDYDRPFTLADVRESEERAAAEGVPFVIEADGSPIGRIGLNQFRERDRVASMYVFIGERDAWGKGYGREAIEAALAYAFDTLNLRLVQLWTLADNDRAIALYKAVGFVIDGTLRDRSVLAGRTIDHIYMSISREEFAKSRS